MSKYIIDTGNYLFTTDGALIVGFDCDNKPATFYNSLDNLEELNSDYINEHFGELQDEAYQRGYEDGKKFTEKGCEGCKYVFCGDTEDPCCHCRRCYKDKYEPAPHSDRIEVGDEVQAPCGIATVTSVKDDFVHYLYSDGDVGCIGPHSLKKTGKHYDIASILEAMRNDR